MVLSTPQQAAQAQQLAGDLETLDKTIATELARDRISRRHLSQVFLGRMYDPEGATDAGFLDQVVDAEAVVDAAVEHAQALSAVSRGGLKRTRVTSRGAIADAIRAGLAEDLSHFSVQG